MFTYNVYIGNIASGAVVWTLLDQRERPLYDTTTLDESLDSGKLRLVGKELTNIVPYKTPIRIDVIENGTRKDRIYRCVANVKRTMRRFSGTKLYDYDIETVEWTKLLERTVCDNLTFTNNLTNDYSKAAISIEAVVSGNPPYYNTNIPQSIFTPVMSGNSVSFAKPTDVYTMTTASQLAGYTPQFGQLILTAPDGQITNYGDNATTITFPNSGAYTVVYSMNYLEADMTTQGFVRYAYTIDAVDVNIAPEPWKIGGVVRRVLANGKTRRALETQKFIFEDTEYDDILSPEFYISQSTMFDALNTIGGKIHAIPRLRYNGDTAFANGVLGYVTFDKLGLTATKTITDAFTAEIHSINGDEYCGAIDSTAENLLTTINPNEGSLQYPFSGGNITPRSQSVRISNDTAIIGETQAPIYKVTDLTATINGVTKSIFPYVYEKAKYDTLSSYTGTVYPYSKSYALFYTMGGNIIDGLSFKAQDSITIATAWQKPALVNIINVVFGDNTITYDFNTQDQVFTTAPAFKDISFNLTYVPYVNARLTQLRPHLDRPLDNTLIFNQGGNTIESNYYGTRLSGVIARLGNEVLVRSYKFLTYAELPSVGQILTLNGIDYYIAVVSTEYEQNYIACTLTMTPDYNRLSSYLGINSNYRQFDVSEKQSVNRYINYGEVCLVGENITAISIINNNHPFITDEGIAQIQRTFTQTAGKQVSFVDAQGFSGDALRRVLLPCSSISAGNSLAFVFKYTDNYGAGYQSQDVDAANARRRLVPYGDAYGGMETLNLNLHSSTAGGLLTSGYEDLLPEYDGTVPVLPLFNTATDNRFLIAKDSRERLTMTIQQHFVGDSDIEIGAALTEYCPLVTEFNSNLVSEDGDEKICLVFSLDKINALNAPKVIQLTDYVHELPELTTTATDLGFNLHAVNPLSGIIATYQSWGIYVVKTVGTKQYAKLMVGKNIPTTQSTFLDIYFNFLDNENIRRLTQ